MKLHLRIVLLGLITFTFTADGLKCVQCEDCSSNWPPPYECKENYICAKYVQAGLLGKVERKCAVPIMRALHGTCSGKGSRKLCSYFCETDGCNGAPAGFQLSRAWAILSGILLLWVTTSNGWL